MRIPRFYIPQPLATGQTLELPPDLFRHAIQVLRMKTDELLILFNGEGGEFLSRVTEVARRKASVNILSHDPVDRESGLRITLVQSIIKTDKMDFALQKSVELGITEFQPVTSQRSVIKPAAKSGQGKLKKKLEHWQAVAIGACEQSGRTRIPAILPPQKLEHWLRDTANISADSLKIILAPGEHPRIDSLKIAKPTPTNFCLLIGPEGGFSDEETQMCIGGGVKAISMGPRILRAETASLAATTLLQHHFGDL